MVAVVVLEKNSKSFLCIVLFIIVMSQGQYWGPHMTIYIISKDMQAQEISNLFNFFSSDLKHWVEVTNLGRFGEVIGSGQAYGEEEADLKEASA